MYKIENIWLKKHPSLPQGVWSGLAAIAIEDSIMAPPKRHVPVADVLGDESMALGGRGPP